MGFSLFLWQKLARQVLWKTEKVNSLWKPFSTMDTGHSQKNLLNPSPFTYLKHVRNRRKQKQKVTKHCIWDWVLGKDNDRRVKLCTPSVHCLHSCPIYSSLVGKYLLNFWNLLFTHWVGVCYSTSREIPSFKNNIVVFVYLIQPGKIIFINKNRRKIENLSKNFTNFVET